MSDREYVVLNTSIRTGSNSNQLLVNEDGDVQATIDLRLPDNIFAQNTGVTKVANVEMQTSKMRLSMINTPVAELPLDREQTNSSQVVSTAQLDIYPYSILDNGRIVPVPGNTESVNVFPKYKEHYVTIEFLLVDGWDDKVPTTTSLGEVTVQANAFDSTFPEGSRFSELVKKAGVMTNIDHMMNLCAQTNHDFDIDEDGEKVYIKNIGTLEQILQDALENAITYASTSTYTRYYVFLLPMYGATSEIPEGCVYQYAPERTNTMVLQEFDNRVVCYWFGASADKIYGAENPDVSTFENTLKWAVKPRVKITDNGITITYDSASFDKVVPVLWNTGFVDTEDQPKQMTIDSMRNDAWNQPPPKRVYKYGVATSEETYTNSYDGDMKGYQFTLVGGTTCAPMNIIVNNAFKNMFSFLPWVEFNPTLHDFGKIMDDIDGTPAQGGMIEYIDKYEVKMEDAKSKHGYNNTYYIITNNGGSNPDSITPYNSTFVSHNQPDLRRNTYVFNDHEGLPYFKYYYQLNDPELGDIPSNRKRQHFGWSSNVQTLTHHGFRIYDKPIPIFVDERTINEPLSGTVIDNWSTIVPQPGLESGVKTITETAWTDTDVHKLENQGVVIFMQWGCPERESINEENLVDVQVLHEGEFINNEMFSIPSLDKYPGWATFTTEEKDGESWFCYSWSMDTYSLSDGDKFYTYEFESDPATNPTTLVFENNHKEESSLKVTQTTTITQVSVKDYPDLLQNMYLYPNITNIPEDTTLYKPITSNGVGTGFGFSGQSSYMTDPTNTFYILDGTSANVSIGPQEVIEVGNGGYTVVETNSIPSYMEKTLDMQYYWNGELYTPEGRPTFPTSVSVAVGTPYHPSGGGTINNTIAVYDITPSYDGDPSLYITGQYIIATSGVDYWYCSNDGGLYISHTTSRETIPAQSEESTYTSYDDLEPGTTTTTTDITISDYKPPASIIDSVAQYKIVTFDIDTLGGTRLGPFIFQKYRNGWMLVQKPETAFGHAIDSVSIPNGGGTIYYYKLLQNTDSLGNTSVNYFESSNSVYKSHIERVDSNFTKTTTKTVTKNSAIYSGNVALTFTWENIPMVVLSPIQSIVLTMTGVQLNQEIMPVNIANTTNVGSSLVSTIPVIQNFFSFAASMRDLHDELVITKEDFDNTATYTVSTTGGQERSIQISAKYITKDGKVHQIYIPRYGVFTVQLIFGIDFYSTH